MMRFAKSMPPALAVAVVLASCRPSSGVDVVLPALDAPAKFSGHCDRGLAKIKTHIAKLENADKADAAWLHSLDTMLMALDNLGNVAGLYEYTHPENEQREVGAKCGLRAHELWTQLGFSEALYRQVSSMDADSLDADAGRWHRLMLRDFKRNAIDAPLPKRQRLQALVAEITALGQDFSRNIREDQSRIKIEAEELSGLPQDFVDALTPDANGHLFAKVDSPSFQIIMRYADSDALRLRMYRAFLNRAHPENADVLRRMLEKRHQLATLLDYPSYAAYHVEDKMVGSVAQVRAFLDELHSAAEPAARRDYLLLLEELRRLHPDAKTVGSWRKTYVTDRIEKRRFGVDSQKVRTYFRYDRVERGIFELIESMFGVEIKPWRTETWHEDVRAFAIYEKGELLGHFFLDMHPRPGKYSHAAHFTLRGGVLDRQTPISALVCNFPRDGYLEHRQVETFLHEFGHLIHNQFGGRQRYLRFSGIATERDFIEAPSQMLEEWIWDEKSLRRFAINDAGEPIPSELIDALRAARYFTRGLWIRHQIYYSMLSLHYHDTPPDELDLDEDRKELQSYYSDYPPLSDTAFYSSFGHLFGYSAGYYAYLWSLAIAADLFSVFEDQGMDNRQVAMRYRRGILEPGGSKDAMDLVEDFLGRPLQLQRLRRQLDGD